MKKYPVKKIGILLLLVIGIVTCIRSVRFQSVDDYRRETEQIKEELQMKEETSLQAGETGGVTEAAVTDTETTPEAMTGKKEPTEQKNTTKSKDNEASKNLSEKDKSSSGKKSTIQKNDRKNTSTKTQPTDKVQKNQTEKNTKAAKNPAKNSNINPAKKQQEQPQNKQPQSQPDDTIRCTIDIRCDALLPNKNLLSEDKKKIIPQDGVILSTLEVTAKKGDSVFDILMKVCRSKNIALDYEFTIMFGTYYVKGIAGLYEFDAGDDGGWKYTVNGKYPNVGSSSYQVQNNDVIHWIYSIDRND